MTPREADMRQTLADILRKPSTPGREAAAANIMAALGRKFPGRKKKAAPSNPTTRRCKSAAKSPPRGTAAAPRVKDLSFYDKERLKILADSREHGDKVRDWARRVLAGGETMTERDADFLMHLDRK